MTSRNKSGSPSIPPEHPAFQLSYGTNEQVQTLSKLHPIYISHENLPLFEKLKTLRNDYRYLYVINWIYNYRGYLKLQSEYFDVDLFEMELLGLVNPPPIDENALFIGKLKAALTNSLQTSKSAKVNDFEEAFRLWFGFETILGADPENEDGLPSKTFETLSIEGMFDVLFTIIRFISLYSQFRSYLSKCNLPLEELRVDPVFSKANRGTHSTKRYILLFDRTRLYEMTSHYPELVIPKKRSLSPNVPEEAFKAEQFDVTSIEFQLISSNIYEFNDYLVELYGKRKNKEMKKLYSALTAQATFESIFEAEIRKRKYLTNRRKEVQLANLLATRKRSSRLEAKQKQRQEELEQLRLQEEEEMRNAPERRLQRRRMIRSNQDSQALPVNTMMTRGERLKLRKLNIDVNHSPSSDVSQADGISTPVTDSDIDPDRYIKSSEMLDSGYVSDNEEQIPDVSNTFLDNLLDKAVGSHSQDPDVVPIVGNTEEIKREDLYNSSNENNSDNKNEHTSLLSNDIANAPIEEEFSK